MRLAWPLDESRANDDDILAQLSWAETIVRVEVQATETLEHLRREIAAFPAEFLLFFPGRDIHFLGHRSRNVPGTLRCSRWGRLSASRRGRNITMARCNTEMSPSRMCVPVRTLRTFTNGIQCRWHGHFRWKESKKKLDGSGPSSQRTRRRICSGILNAPWKLNSDRNAIIRGEWNKSLMREAACLIVETLQSLSNADDPGRALDAFPRQRGTGRGRRTACGSDLDCARDGGRDS